MSNRPIIGNTVGTPLNPSMFGGDVTSVNGKTGDVKLSAKEVGALSQDELQNGVNLALEQAKESGEFKGADGKDGVDGKNGIDGKDGNDYVLTEADKIHIANITLGLIPIYNGEVEGL